MFTKLASHRVASTLLLSSACLLFFAWHRPISVLTVGCGPTRDCPTIPIRALTLCLCIGFLPVPTVAPPQHDDDIGALHMLFPATPSDSFVSPASSGVLASLPSSSPSLSQPPPALSQGRGAVAVAARSPSLGTAPSVGMTPRGPSVSPIASSSSGGAVPGRVDVRSDQRRGSEGRGALGPNPVSTAAPRAPTATKQPIAAVRNSGIQPRPGVMMEWGGLKPEERADRVRRRQQLARQACDGDDNDDDPMYADELAFRAAALRTTTPAVPVGAPVTLPTPAVSPVVAVVTSSVPAAAFRRQGAPLARAGAPAPQRPPPPPSALGQRHEARPMAPSPAVAAGRSVTKSRPVRGGAGPAASDARGGAATARRPVARSDEGSDWQFDDVVVSRSGQRPAADVKGTPGGQRGAHAVPRLGDGDGDDGCVRLMDMFTAPSLPPPTVRSGAGGAHRGMGPPPNALASESGGVEANVV